MYLKSISKQHQVVFKILSDSLGLLVGTFSLLVTHAIHCLILVFLFVPQLPFLSHFLLLWD